MDFPKGWRGMDTHILEHTFEEYREIAKTFHGAAAPGVLIGGFMVDTAIGNLPDGIIYDAICETRSCLPDAIQILTPCTVGNGWLKIVHLGLFALTLYDKSTYDGVRVFLDAEKVEPWQEIKAWYFKLKSSKEQNRESIIREIGEAGTSILSISRVKIQPEAVEKRHKGKIVVCSQCREAYPSDDGVVCLSCQGNAPYALRTCPGYGHEMLRARAIT
jgi:formylmethanofuran dehydrogenase subunit E